MHPRRNKEKLQQLTEFERGRITSLREGGFSYHAIGARVQEKSSPVMRVWKRWTDEYRTTRKTGSAQRKVTSVPDDRYLLHMAVNDRRASSKQLAVRWSTATDESFFNLWVHDGHICVRRYAGVRCLPECVIERHSGLTPGVMVWGAISYHGQSNLLRIEGIPGAIFQQDNTRPHVAKTVPDFSSAQHIQLLPWPAYSPDMSSIKYVWDLVGRRFARDSRPAVSKDELLLCIKAIWNFLPLADIQNLFDSMPRRITALIAARIGYTKY
ncbi:transposable element Tc1 transposase [Trichonephila clavipes]|nr:transposable element Tc1 transposase [Trichonephila clavipes]